MLAANQARFLLEAIVWPQNNLITLPPLVQEGICLAMVESDPVSFRPFGCCPPRRLQRRSSTFYCALFLQVRDPDWHPGCPQTAGMQPPGGAAGNNWWSLLLRQPGASLIRQ